MKKFLLLLALAFAVLPAGAQSKLDLLSKAQLRAKRLELAKISDSQFTQKMKALKRSFGVPSNNVLAIIRLNDGNTEQDLQAQGVKVLRCSHGFAFVSVPIDQVETVSQLKCVRFMQLSRTMKPMLKNARALTGVDKIHQGLNLSQAYTGKGVITGVVDGGIDPNHINFKDADGNSRVGHFAYLTINPNATEVNEAVITKYYDATTINKFTTDDNSSYHGTHTMGIMAGGYRGDLNVAEADVSTGLASISSMANPYYGVAYDSEIAAACGELYDIVIATGVEDILMYADEQQKPCVINLSLGSNNGTHDGIQTGTAGSSTADGKGVSAAGTMGGGRSLKSINKSLQVKLSKPVVVKVEVTVDADGRSSHARCITPGVDASLRRKVEQQSNTARWTPKKGAPNATGTITWTIAPRTN